MNNLNSAYVPESITASQLDGNADATFLGLLDSQFPLTEGSHCEVTQYRVYFDCLLAHLKSGQCVGLRNPRELHDFGGERECPSSIVLKNAERQIELTF